MHIREVLGLLQPVLDKLFLGVIMVDHNGLIVYYNQRHAEIDELTPEEVLGYRIREVYAVSDEESPSMIALATRKMVKSDLMYYKTARGKQISSLNYAFPLLDGSELKGAICLTADVSGLGTQLIAVKNSKQRVIQPKISTAPKGSFESLIGKNPVFREAVDVAKVAALGPSPVMLVGETGTGKDLFAKAIHDYGTRSGKPYITINCSAIPEALLEGILFGTTKGAFTGAVEKEGLLEHASGGTIFLDEINSMPLALQAKLLRVMQDHQVRRVGGLTEKNVDLRIISASNINPLKAIDDKQLRPDLYYRLGVIQVTIPPLRERPEDIPLLVNHFIKKISERLGKNITGINAQVLESLMNRPWPGNARELQHAIESALNFTSNGEQLTLRHLKRATRHVVAPHISETIKTARGRPEDEFPWSPSERKTSLREKIEQVERHWILEALKNNKGAISAAATELGLSSQSLTYKINKYKLRADPFKY